MSTFVDGEPSRQWVPFAGKQLATIQSLDLPAKSLVVNGYKIQVLNLDGIEKVSIKEPDRLLKSYGGNIDGALGLEGFVSAAVPTVVRATPNWVAVSGGGGHSAGIRSDGTLWMWGYNNVGQLGLGDTTSRSTPTLLKVPGPWVQVTCGQYHTAAIKADGTLWTWGRNCNGQLGLVDESFAGQGTFSGCNGAIHPEWYVDSHIPQKVGVRKWKCVSAGGFNTYAIRDDGTLWYAGSFHMNTLGGTLNVATFSQLGSDSDWETVSGGYQHAMVLKLDGSLWANGDYSLTGAIGLPARAFGTIFVNAGPWDVVSAGADSTLAVSANGSLWATGLNSNGQLGVGAVDVTTFTAVSSGPWKLASTNGRMSAGIKADGSLWSWGYGTPRNIPGSVPGTVDDSLAWWAVSAGYFNFFLAILGWKGRPDFAPLNKIPGALKFLS